MDLFAAKTASAAPRARVSATSEASPRPCIIRELSATPRSSGSVRLIGHREDVGGLVSVSGNPQHPIGDSRPTSLVPLWIRRPARNGRSGSGIRRPRHWAQRAGYRAPRPADRCRRPRRRKPRSGQVISVSVTSWPLMAKPPVIIRLCATNCLSSSEIAGPDQAIQPSDSRNRRWASRGSSASRSCSWRTKSTRALAVLSGSSS